MPEGAVLSSKTLQDDAKERKKAHAEERKRKRKAKSAELKASRPLRSLKLTCSMAQQQQQAVDESEEEPLHEKEDQDFDEGTQLSQLETLGSAKVKSFLDEELQRRLEQLNIPKDYGSFLTEEEIKVIREITIFMSQDHALVVKLLHAADLMAQERQRKEQEEEAKREAERAAEREKARKAREDEMKKKGKEKLEEKAKSLEQTQYPDTSMTP